MIGSVHWSLWAFWVAVYVVNVAASGIFSGMETGIYLLNKVRLELQAATGDRPAIRLRTFISNSDNALSVMLIGTNIHSYLATFAISAMFVMAGLGDQAEWLTLLVATPLAFVFKDSLPKAIFTRTPERQTRRFSMVLSVADVLFRFTGLSLLVRFFARGVLLILGRGKAIPPRGWPGPKVL